MQDSNVGESVSEDERRIRNVKRILKEAEVDDMVKVEVDNGALILFTMDYASINPENIRREAVFIAIKQLEQALGLVEE